MKNKFLKILSVVAVVLVSAIPLTACGAKDNTAEIDKLKQERDTAITERDTANSGKSAAQNKMEFYKAMVDGLTASFQCEIDSITKAANDASPAIKELCTLVTDVFQNVQDGNVNVENFVTLLEVFATQFSTKFDALYEKIDNDETGFTALDGYSLFSPNTIRYYSCYISRNIDLNMGGALNSVSLYINSTNVHVYAVNGNEELACFDSVYCYPNGIVEFCISDAVSVYIKGGELLSVSFYKDDYSDFIFAEGAYTVGDGLEGWSYAIGNLLLEILIDDVAEEITVTINDAPTVIGSVNGFINALTDLGFEVNELFDNPCTEAIVVYGAQGYNGLIANVNAKIALMRQVIAAMAQ